MHYGKVLIDFGTDSYKDTVVVTVNDPLIIYGSWVVPNISPAWGRDSDECELEAFTCSIINITPKAGFTVAINNSLTGGAEGLYNLNYLVMQ